MRSAALLLAAGLSLVASGTTYAQQAPACQFVLGFKTLHDLVPSNIGDCRTDQSYAANGDAQQQTAKGLLVWRKADNWTAFTDGYQTWINGPAGLITRLNTERFPWEADYGAPGTTKILPPLPVLAPNGRPWTVVFDHNLVLPNVGTIGPSGEVQVLNAQGFWLNVYFVVRNNLSRAATITASDVSLVDKQGRKYVSNFDIRQVDQKGVENDLQGTIAPGAEALLRLTFDVARDASGGVLHVAGGNDIAAL